MSERESIEAFWQWWPSVAASIAAAFTSGGLSQELVEIISERVHDIHADLDWEFGPGEKSQHLLALSGRGDPALRVVTERWLHRAPAADATWEFFASRRASNRRGLVIEIDDVEVDLDGMSVDVEEDASREKLNVRVHHPAFATMKDPGTSVRVTFIALDNALGEDDVERWLGSVDTAEAPGAAPVLLPDLPARVAAFAATATREKWMILRGTVDDHTVFITLNAALKRIDHLLLDTHVELTIPLAEPTEEGLTTTDESDVLNAMEDELVAMFGSHAVQIGRETGFGKRSLHFHVMEGGPAASVVARFQAKHPAYAMQVAIRPDVRWDILDRWT